MMVCFNSLETGKKKRTGFPGRSASAELAPAKVRKPSNGNDLPWTDAALIAVADGAACNDAQGRARDCNEGPPPSVTRPQSPVGTLLLDPNAWEGAFCGPDEAMIYVLVDPRNTGEWRYVGQSICPLARLITHCGGEENNGARGWVRRLRGAGLHPVMLSLETTTRERAFKRESFWIREGLRLGHPLLNQNTPTPFNDAAVILAALASQPRYITPATLASLLGISGAALRVLRLQDKGPPCFGVTRHTVRYDTEGVRDWVIRHLVEGVA